MNKTKIIGTEEEDVYERGKALAKKVNREAELEAKEAAREEKAAARQARLGRKSGLESKTEQPPKLERNQTPYLDKEPWKEDNEIKRFTQDNWIPKYNEAEKIMASAADYYHAAKLGDEALASIQRCFNDSRVTTSTRIIYKQKKLEGTIIHHYGSKVTNPVERKLLIPVYGGDILSKNVLDTAEGLKFVQGLFLTQDGKEEILETLGKLGNRNESRLWTLSQDERKNPKHRTYPTRSKQPKRVVSFRFIVNQFHICANTQPETGMRSRGVNFPKKPDQQANLDIYRDIVKKPDIPYVHELGSRTKPYDPMEIKK